jgi:Domain of unknown function (DUF5666)
MQRSVMLAVSVAMVLFVQVVGVGAQSKPKAMSTNGVVKSVSADTLAITAGSNEMTFSLDSSTKFVGKGLSAKSGGAPMKASDAVAAGDRVKVTYHDMSGKLHAASVTVTAKAPKP